MNKTAEKDKIYDEINNLVNWFKECKYNYFSINSLPDNSMINRFNKKKKIVGVIWRQIHRVSPVNIRRVFLLKEPKYKNPKSMILYSIANLELWKVSSQKKHLEEFEFSVNWLISNRSKNHNGFAVPQLKKIFVRGYNSNEWDVSPFLTALAGYLFLKAYQILDDIHYLILAKEAGDYFLYELPKVEKENLIYFYYVPNHPEEARCYNCSALICAFLLRLGRLTGDSSYSEYGRKGIRYILNVQNSDGSWFYGNSRESRYVDNFHTAFILLSLYEARKYNNDKEINTAFENGLNYYRNKQFKKISDNSIRPLHFYGRYLPLNSNIIQKVDLRDSALSIILFSFISNGDDSDFAFASKVLRWTMDNMKGKKGFYCELTWFWANKIPYIEFQAWMLLALSVYFSTLEANRD